MDNQTRRTLTAMLGGLLFGVAWWIVIDGGVHAEYVGDPQKMKGEFLVPCIVASFGLLMILSFKWEDFQGQGMSEFNAKRAKICFFTGMVLIFGSLFGALWVMIEVYARSESKADSKWPGVALVLNVVLQLVAAIIMRATRIQSY